MRNEHDARIRELEKALMMVFILLFVRRICVCRLNLSLSLFSYQARRGHSDRLQKLKSECSDREQDTKERSDKQIANAAREAYRDAVRYLVTHTNHIKLENRELRAQLMQLIEQTQALEEHHEQLQQQRKTLEREQQFAADLSRVRGHWLEQMQRHAANETPHDEAEHLT